jgi:hypothetical protein
MSMRVAAGLDITFLDSHNFLNLKLKDLPSALNLKPGLCKGTYPYLFNTAENEGVVLPHLPDISYYRPDFMSERDRQELLEWHHEHYNKEFDNDKELITYCKSDVTILREACVTFRNLVKKATTLPGAQVPPVEVFASSTLASSSMSIFRQLIMPEFHEVTLIDGETVQARLEAGVYRRMVDKSVIKSEEILRTKFVKSSIPQPPSLLGYNHRNAPHSAKAVQWLEYLGHLMGRRLTHARNGGERRVLNYFLDGWDEESGYGFDFLGEFLLLISNLCIKDCILYYFQA